MKRKINHKVKVVSLIPCKSDESQSRMYQGCLMNDMKYESKTIGNIQFNFLRGILY